MAIAAKYVYGVIPATAGAPSGTGVARRRIHAVTVDDTTAIVSDVPDAELRAGREDLLAHSRVLERAQERGAVLPMRFGVVMPDADAVREQLLEGFHDALVVQLEALEGKVELHLRATYHETALMAGIVDSNPDIAARTVALRGQSADATYYAQIELGQRVAEAVERAREVDTAEILDALEPFAVQIDVGTPEHERVVAHISFLVKEADLPAFDAAVDELGRHHEGRIRFKYTGPFPPYSFVDLPERG
jgi:Gas vesicle synthesis protein GvpL/GvpF